MPLIYEAEPEENIRSAALNSLQKGCDAFFNHRRYYKADVT